jgi:hypothetical protein
MKIVRIKQKPSIEMSTEESPSASEDDPLGIEDQEERNGAVSLGETIPWPRVAWFLDRDWNDFQRRG